MKTVYLRLLWSLVLVLSITQVHFAQTSLIGNVTDGSNGEAILFGNVALYQDGVLVTGAETDFDGNYNISNIDAGTYYVEASYVGLNPMRITDVIVLASKANKLDIEFPDIPYTDLNQVNILPYKVPLIEEDNTTKGGIVTANQIKTLPTKSINGLAATTARIGTAEEDVEMLTVRSGRRNATDYYVDGIRVRDLKTRKNKKVKKAKKASLTGKVTDGSSGEAIIFGNVALYQDAILIKATETDFEGNYTFSKLKAGTYRVEVSYVGLKTTIKKDVLLFEGKITKLNIQMSAGSTSLDEVVVTGYRVPLIERDATSSGIVTKESKVRSSKKNKKREASSPAPSVASSAVYDSDFSGIVSSIPEGKEILVTEAIEEEFDKDAGQITAGEWNDLNNWTFWRELQKDEVYKKWQSHWLFYPNQRYSVVITGKLDQPVSGATITLLTKEDAVIWEGKTDNQGQTELWAAVYGETQEVGRIKIQYQDYETTSRNIRDYTSSGVNHYKIPVDCGISDEVDICFVVDATGSMGDEIQFLKAELKDVIERAKESNNQLNVRLGSVFYRDKGDAYVTQVAPFSSDISQSIDFIRNQYAGGGGDYPEAVHTALEQALAQDWSSTARSRMLFLLLDAPPHHDAAVRTSLQKSIQKAAKMGVKIIPVTASGIKKDTEFLMKYFSVLTNGTYVFITDHSGIGNAHLAPTAEEYNVETLNELMLRLILENTEYEACTSPNTNNLNQEPVVYPVFPTDTPSLDFIQNKDLLQGVQVFPNPAKEHFFLDLKTDFDKVYLLNKAGRLIKSFADIQSGKTQRDIRNLPAGMYVLHFVKGTEMASKKLIVVKD